jgi:N6-adenosine-specific RNA methylase IME4
MPELFPPLPEKKYDVIVADPAVEIKLYSEKGWAKSQMAHYKCLPIEAFHALPVRSIARADSWMLLWTTAPHLEKSFALMHAWGFTYCSRLGWRKVTKNGKPAMGPGFVVRTCHEDVLIGKRGRPLYDRALPSLFDGVARQHSRKPEEFYALIETFLPRAWRIDLFSRLDRPGWDSWGDEAGKFNGDDDGL